MSSLGALEPELERVLDTSWLVFTTKANKPDLVINLLGVVLVSNIKNYIVFFAVKQQPIIIGQRASLARRCFGNNKPCCNVTDQDLCAAPSAPTRSCIDFSDGGYPMGASCDRADGGDIPLSVIHPNLPFRDELMSLNLSSIQRQGEEDLDKIYMVVSECGSQCE